MRLLVVLDRRWKGKSQGSFAIDLNEFVLSDVDNEILPWGHRLCRRLDFRNTPPFTDILPIQMSLLDSTCYLGPTILEVV